MLMKTMLPSTQTLAAPISILRAMGVDIDAGCTPPEAAPLAGEAPHVTQAGRVVGHCH